MEIECLREELRANSFLRSADEIKRSTNGNKFQRVRQLRCVPGILNEYARDLQGNGGYARHWAYPAKKTVVTGRGLRVRKLDGVPAVSHVIDVYKQ